MPENIELPALHMPYEDAIIAFCKMLDTFGQIVLKAQTSQSPDQAKALWDDWIAWKNWGRKMFGIQ